MALYNEVPPEFQRFNAEPMGISVGMARGATPHSPGTSWFPVSLLLADFEPKGAVARTYGARTGNKTASASAYCL